MQYTGLPLALNGSADLGGSEIRVQRFFDVDGENAEAEGVGHFTKQHDRSSWNEMSGAERRALDCVDYRSPDQAFRHLSKESHRIGAWNRADARRCLAQRRKAEAAEAAEARLV